MKMSKTVAMVAQLYEYTNPHHIAHFKYVNCIGYRYTHTSHMRVRDVMTSSLLYFLFNKSFGKGSNLIIDNYKGLVHVSHTNLDPPVFQDSTSEHCCFTP